LGIDLFVKREPIREMGAEWSTTYLIADLNRRKKSYSNINNNFGYFYKFREEK